MVSYIHGFTAVNTLDVHPPSLT